jgi:hypothetical protein
MKGRRSGPPSVRSESSSSEAPAAPARTPRRRAASVAAPEEGEPETDYREVAALGAAEWARRHPISEEVALMAVPRTRADLPKTITALRNVVISLRNRGLPIAFVEGTRAERGSREFKTYILSVQNRILTAALKYWKEEGKNQA